MKKTVKLSALVCITALFIGCTNHVQHQATENNANSGIHKYQAIKQEIDKHQPAIVHRNFPPADLKPISNAGDPDWYSEVVNPVINMFEFAIAVRTVFEGLPVSIGFDEDIDQQLLVSAFHNGTARSWLDELSLASGYAYKISGNHISWHRMATKTFDIMAIPGSQDYLVGTAKEDTQGDNSDSEDQADRTIRNTNSEFTNNAGKLSIWTDLDKTLKSLVSSEGKYVVSTANTSVTVKDFPENLRVIESVINTYNQGLSAQVLLQAQIVAVRLNNSRTDGIDWNLLKTNTNTVLNFSNSFGDIINAATGAPSTFSLSSPEGSNTSLSGSSLLIQALGEQGKVITISSPRTMALNNQVAEIRINQDTTYLAESSTVLTDTSSEVSLTPGVVEDGFTMYALPKIDIKNRNVFIHMSTTLADLQGIDTVEAGNSAIQTPQLQKTKINSRAKLKSGETFILSGFQQAIDDSRRSNNYGLNLFGQRGSSTEKFEVLILITPVILSDA